MGIVFIGTPEFAVPSLVGLAESGYEITTVVTQPDRRAGRGQKPRFSPVKQAALSLGLSVLQPASLRDEGVVAEIASLRPDVMVAVAYGQILRREVLSIAPRGLLNVHPSLLPKYRGASPIQSAILAGEDITGVTIMLMDEGMDSGPILAQESSRIADDDTGGSLSQKLSHLGARMLVETIGAWLKGGIEPQPQDDGAASTTRLLEKEDGRIDWTQPARRIWLQVRAFDPWPGTYTHLDGERLSVLRVYPIQDHRAAGPGEVVEASDPEGRKIIAVGTWDSLLALDTVQREGRKAMAAVDLAKGARGFVGSVLK
jgi:methionyl-tRNA formyltransferase